MKTLMLGNEAAARGLFEAGCSFVSSYPGTPSTEITECAAKYPEIYAEWAPNEKVAMEAAFGASLSGRRKNTDIIAFFGITQLGIAASNGRKHRTRHNIDNRINLAYPAKILYCQIHLLIFRYIISFGALLIPAMSSKLYHASRNSRSYG